MLELYAPAVDTSGSPTLVAVSDTGHRKPGTTRAAKRARQRRILELASARTVTNQQGFVRLLAEQGFDVTQATVSRDIAELGLVKVQHGGRHVYASASDVAASPAPTSDERLRRVLSDYPVRVGRSGLTLLLVSEPATAAAIAEAIDESTFDTQEGTLAGDNTVLVLFADEARLRTWRQRFEELVATVTAAEAAR